MEDESIERIKLREDVARAWGASSDDVEASAEPFESGFVARATVLGINLSEAGLKRETAMARLVEAARVRGAMERGR